VRKRGEVVAREASLASLMRYLVSEGVSEGVR